MCKMYKLDEVAYILGAEISTVKKWIREGRIKNVKVVQRNDGHYDRYVLASELENITLTNKQIELLECKLRKAELERDLARLELREYQLYQDTCFIGEFKEHLREMEL